MDASNHTDSDSGKIKSHAHWSSASPDSTHEHKTHSSIELAKGIARSLVMLYTEQYPCKTNGVCLDAWVTVDGIRHDIEEFAP